MNQSERIKRLTKREIVDYEERDEDGYWIYLKYGFQVDGDHAIVESTKRYAHSKLSLVKRCDCASCVAYLTTGKKS